MVGGSFSDLASSSTAVRAGAGGLVLFGQPPAGSGPAIRAGIARLVAAAEVRPLVSTDEEGGGVARLSEVIGAVPWPREMAASMSPAQVRRLIARRAQEMRRLGLDMDLAPVLDAAPATETVGAENLRSFSEDPAAAASYGVAFLEGLREGGVLAVGKHFPGLGHVSADTDLGPARVPPLSQLEGRDLVPFEAAISGHVPVMMMSNATVPGLGSSPASLEPAAYAYLRHLGFRGVILTDSLDTGAIQAAGYTAPEAAAKAIESGADMAMVTSPGDFEPTVAALEQAVAAGALPLGQVQASVRRILALKGG